MLGEIAIYVLKFQTEALPPGCLARLAPRHFLRRVRLQAAVTHNRLHACFLGLVSCSTRRRRGRDRDGFPSRRLCLAAVRRGGQGRRSRDRSHAQPLAASMARTRPLTVPSTVALRGTALGSCLRLGSGSGRAGATASAPSRCMPGEPFLLKLHSSCCRDLLQGCLRGRVERRHPLRRRLRMGFTASLAAVAEP